jgi:hypothetical protein
MSIFDWLFGRRKQPDVSPGAAAAKEPEEQRTDAEKIEAIWGLPGGSGGEKAREGSGSAYEAAAGAGNAPGREFTCAEGGFSARLPCAPAEQSIKSAGGWVSGKSFYAALGLSVSNIGGESGRLDALQNASANSYARTAVDADRTPDREAEARRIYHALRHAADADLMALARVLAVRAGGQGPAASGGTPQTG